MCSDVHCLSYEIGKTWSSESSWIISIRGQVWQFVFLWVDDFKSRLLTCSIAIRLWPRNPSPCLREKTAESFSTTNQFALSCCCVFYCCNSARQQIQRHFMAAESQLEDWHFSQLVTRFNWKTCCTSTFSLRQGRSRGCLTCHKTSKRKESKAIFNAVCVSSCCPDL